MTHSRIFSLSSIVPCLLAIGMVVFLCGFTKTTTDPKQVDIITSDVIPHMMFLVVL